MSRLDVISMDEWIVYYIDGKEYFQHHSMAEPDIIEMIIDNKVTEYHWYTYEPVISLIEDEKYGSYEADAWLEERGVFPELFSDVPSDLIRESSWTKDRKQPGVI